jgi:hypothetical protein
MGSVPYLNRLAALSGVGSWDFGDLMLLQQIGVLHRVKRYSRRYYVNPDTAIGSDSKHADSSGIRHICPRHKPL